MLGIGEKAIICLCFQIEMTLILSYGLSEGHSRKYVGIGRIEIGLSVSSVIG